MKRTLAVALLACAGCSLSPDYTGTQYRCEDDDGCPRGLECIDQRCQDALLDRIDGSPLDAPIDGSVSTACGGGQPIFIEKFDGDTLDEQVWSASTDATSVAVVDGRLSIEPQGSGATGTVTTDAAFQLDGTRLTIEVLPIDDISSSGTSVTLVEPGSSFEHAGFVRDTFDLELQTGESDVQVLDYDAIEHRYWRFELEGDTIRFYASRDGAMWDLLATDPDASFPVEAELSIWVENYAGDIQPYRFDSITWCTLD